MLFDTLDNHILHVNLCNKSIGAQTEDMPFSDGPASSIVLTDPVQKWFAALVRCVYHCCTAQHASVYRAYMALNETVSINIFARVENASKKMFTSRKYEVGEVLLTKWA